MYGLLDAISYMFAIINPFSKMCYISALSEKYDEKELIKLSIKANVFAFILLSIFILTGDIILRDFFHIDINALKIAGGIIIAKIGYDYISKGVNLQGSEDENEIAAVPLGTPMIAGPGSITMAITLAASQGFLITFIATGLALALNFMLMLASAILGERAGKVTIHIFVKIVGLFILALGINLVMSGIQGFVTISLIKLGLE